MPGNSNHRDAVRLQASPEFKGIKTVASAGSSQACGLQASPEFKGIKTASSCTRRWRAVLQASPEFKGIKTCFTPGHFALAALQASPEFKGIKTSSAIEKRLHFGGFKPALNSKGLRPQAAAATKARVRFKPALNSKGLRLPRGFRYCVRAGASSQP